MIVQVIMILFALTIIGCGKPSQPPASESVYIPMRDGIELATDLFFPEEVSSPYPVVLIRTPYNKDWLSGYGQYYAKSNFVVAIQDVRGRWKSEGEWEPFIHEGDDGYDSIEWLSSQEWCNGKVGMVGGSYSGTVQFAAAVEKPPHLVTIIPNVTPATPFDNIPREGGALALGWALRWTNIIENAKSEKALQNILQKSIQTDWYNPFLHLPVVELDRSVVGREVSYFQNWARRSPEDEYWKSAEYLSDLANIDIPVFLQGGWFDPGIRGTQLAFENLMRGKNRRVRMMIGPWVHGDRGSRYLNGIDMGVAAERDIMAEYRKWLDFFLNTDARDAADSPGVELYVMGANRWINSSSYPLKETSNLSLYLTGSSGESGSGRLMWEQPNSGNTFDTFTYDPESPTPSFHAALKRGALQEYKLRMDTASDVLIYESEPFKKSLNIAGPIKVILFAATSAKDTDWTATLYGLSNAGEIRVLGLTFGILRARYRESMTDPSLIKPNEVYTYEIDMGHTAVTINPNERLRLEIASAAFPEFSRNLNTGGNNEIETKWIKANQRIYRSRNQASHLILPMVE